jgi:hypothetical protein
LPFAGFVLAISAVAIVAATLFVWHKTSSSRLRFGLLVLASALVNPHLSTYDASILVLPALWIGGELLESGTDSSWFWQRSYWIAWLLFLPTAAIVRLQLSTFLMAELFVRVAVTATRRSGFALQGVSLRRPARW